VDPLPRHRAALWLLLPLFALQPAPPARADDNCVQWMKLSQDIKRKGVEKSFKDQASWGSDANRDACLRDSATAMAGQIERRCREGGVLNQVWQRAGYSWMVICTVVASRVESGVPTGDALRLEMQSVWDKCTDEGAGRKECQERITRRYVSGFAGETRKTECQGFLELPFESQLTEVGDRVTERFSATPDVARCMNASAPQIATEVGALCRRKVRASEAWRQVLDSHTDHCLQRDFGL
jgi:hypothetical protein